MRHALPLIVAIMVLALAGPSAYAGPHDKSLADASKLIDRGDYRTALVRAGEINAEAALDDVGTQSAALVIRARALADLGVFRDAHESLDAALAMLVNSPHVERLVEILIALGELKHVQGDIAGANSAFSEAQAWNKTLTTRTMSARLERSLARLARVRGDHQQALARYISAGRRCALSREGRVCSHQAAIGRAWAHLASGDALTARRVATDVLIRLSPTAHARQRARALHALAQSHRQLGDTAKSLARAKQALGAARAIGHKPLLAATHRLLGELSLDTNELERARGHLKAANQHFVSMGSLPGIASSRLILSRLARRAGSLSESEIHARAAQQAFARLQDEAGIADATMALAAVAAARNDVKSERRWLTKTAAHQPAPAAARQIQSRLGDLSVAAADRRAAIEHYELAAQAAERVDPERLAPAARERQRADRLEVYDKLLKAQLSTENPTAEDVSRAIHTSERSVARAFVDVLERARLVRNSPDTAALVSKLNALDSKQRRIAEQHATASAGDAPAFAVQLQRLAAARSDIERQVIDRRPTFLRTDGTVVSARIRRATDKTMDGIRRDVALIKFHLAHDQSFAFVMHSDATTVHRLPSRDQLAPMILAYTELLERPASSRRSARLRDRLGRKLYETLLEPLEEALDGRERIVVVPHLETRLVPFDALVLGTTLRASERRLARRNRTAPYAIYRFTFSTAPSVAAISEMHEDALRRQSVQRHPFVAFADPKYEGLKIDLPRLKRSASEATQAHALIGAGDATGAVFLREDATEQRLKELALSRYRIVHLATHGFAPDVIDEATQPALFLGKTESQDGVLQLDEVVDLRLNADLVVLSACSSGRGALNPGDGLGGLTRAFLSAGTSAVMATLWAVEDSHAESMMTAFYRDLAAHKATAPSLRQARLAMLAGIRPTRSVASRHRGIGGIVTQPVVKPTPPPRKTKRRTAPIRSRDPFFWASYVLVGESGDILR